MNTLKKIGAAILGTIAFKLVFFNWQNFLDYDLLIIPFIILILWEGNIRIDRKANEWYNWQTHTKQRIASQFLLSLVFTILTLVLLMNFIHFVKFKEINPYNGGFALFFLPALSIALFVEVLYVSIQFFKAWNRSLLELERQKAESANAQLHNLKSQINPHFLFNNLSVLTSLVYQNQDKAAAFISELSKVYRYILDNKSAELVTLQEELDFLKHYSFLLKIRLDSSLSFDTNIEEAYQKYLLPPMCLQMLVENTIQHNEASQAKPLQVLIYNDKESLYIENNIQARSDLVDSSKTGLKNIASRYAFFTNRKVEVFNDGISFKVVLPLILT
jgi:sensor histidine kinase YesM